MLTEDLVRATLELVIFELAKEQDKIPLDPITLYIIKDRLTTELRKVSTDAEFIDIDVTTCPSFTPPCHIVVRAGAIEVTY